MNNISHVYGSNCDIKKELEKLRTELNNSMRQNPLDRAKIMSRSMKLDKLVLHCMKCEIEECPYSNKL